MTVFQNVAFPLINGPHRLSSSEREKESHDRPRYGPARGLADRPAPFLSGGQQQRVALARALACRTESALDGRAAQLTLDARFA
jgi:iron(III) transport system ATP-binding protein